MDSEILGKIAIYKDVKNTLCKTYYCLLSFTLCILIIVFIMFIIQSYIVVKHINLTKEKIKKEIIADSKKNNMVIHIKKPQYENFKPIKKQKVMNLPQIKYIKNPNYKPLIKYIKNPKYKQQIKCKKKNEYNYYSDIGSNLVPSYNKKSNYIIRPYY